METLIILLNLLGLALIALPVTPILLLIYMWYRAKVSRDKSKGKK